jgi:hypothetical protein
MLSYVPIYQIQFPAVHKYWTVRAARRWVQRLLLLLLQPRWETKRLLTGAARDATALIPWRAAGDNGQFHLLLWLHCVCLSGRCIDARIPTINAISFFILLSCFCCMRREMRFEKFSFVSSRAAAKLRPLQFSNDAMPTSSIKMRCEKKKRAAFSRKKLGFLSYN